jgi:hypothetical protein
VGNVTYQLSYAFGNWLFHALSGPDPATIKQQQQLMAELRRRQEEAIRLHQQQEAQQLTEIFNRLIVTMKLSGLPQLKMMYTGTELPELHMKLGENGDQGIALNGIKGLPGINLNGGNPPGYGIPGLPGIYTGGPEQGPGLSNTPLPFKTGDQDSPGLPAPRDLPPASGTLVTANMQPAPVDPSKMTTQQLADAAGAFSKLSPEEQHQILARVQQQATAGQAPQAAPQTSAQTPVVSLPGQSIANSSQAAASTANLDEASKIARTGFDTAGAPDAPLAFKLSGSNSGPPAQAQTPANMPSGSAAPSRQSVAPTGAPADLLRFTVPDGVEQAYRRMLDANYAEGEALIPKMAAAMRSNDPKAIETARREIDANAAERIQMTEELDALQLSRLQGGMSRILKVPKYAEAWKATEERVRAEEKEAFAEQNAEHDRIEDELLNHGGTAADLEQEEFRLRKAQVATLAKSTRELQDEAVSLMKQAASDPAVRWNQP